MTVRINFEGLNELRQGLQNLPQTLAAEAAQVVSAAADQCAQETKSAYPVRQTNLTPGYRRKTPWYPPGILRGRVTITNKSTNVSAAYAVKSAAPHAHLFENGTHVRHTKNGANRGAMPAAPIEERMIPRVIRIRARMVDRLIQIVRDAGFETGQT